MKNFMITGASSAFICYCVGSFVAWEWDPEVWGTEGRVLLFVLWFVMTLTSTAYERVKDELKKAL